MFVRLTIVNCELVVGVKISIPYQHKSEHAGIKHEHGSC